MRVGFQVVKISGTGVRTKKGRGSLTIADTEGVDATMREEHNSLTNTYQNTHPTRRFNRTSISGVIEIFVIFDPTSVAGRKPCRMGQVGLFST